MAPSEQDMRMVIELWSETNQILDRIVEALEAIPEALDLAANGSTTPERPGEPHILREDGERGEKGHLP